MEAVRGGKPLGLLDLRFLSLSRNCGERVARRGSVAPGEGPMYSRKAPHPPRFARRGKKLELQRLGGLHLRQRADLREHVGGYLAVDLDQRNGVAAGRFAT